jgi:hypothetical protein
MGSRFGSRQLNPARTFFDNGAFCSCDLGFPDGAESLKKISLWASGLKI